MQAVRIWKQLRSLDIRGGEGLADLTGLEAAVNLNWLTLEECGITSEFMEKNADVLAALPKLYTFYLWNNEITDISFLESIPQVKNIVLDNNEITDFRPALSSVKNTRMRVSVMGIIRWKDWSRSLKRVTSHLTRLWLAGNILRNERVCAFRPV